MLRFESPPRSSSKPEGEGKARDLSRREFLLYESSLAALGVGAAITSPLWAEKYGGTAKKAPLAAPKAKIEAPRPQVEKDWWTKRSYQTPKKLVGARLHPLEVNYLRPANDNILSKGRVPEQLPPIDFSENLGRMLAEKRRLTINGHVGSLSDKLATYDRLDASYKDRWEKDEVRRMSLPEFSGLIQEESMKMRAALKEAMPRIVEVYLSKAVESDKELTAAEKKRIIESLPAYLMKLAEGITPEIMMSFMAAELMPSPERSAAVLGFLTENAGLEFLASVPALGDVLLSYGGFQLTKFVIAANDNVDERGCVTQLLRVMGTPDLLPGSLTKFTSMEQHIQAGYLFAFFNLLSLSQDSIQARHYGDLGVVAETIQTPANAGVSPSTVFLEYLSAAHHRPAVAATTARSYLAANAHIKDPAKRDKTLKNYFPSNDNGVSEYADRARASFRAMREQLAVAA